MAGRDQPENDGTQDPGTGYTANPYDDPQTRAFGAGQNPQYPDPTAQYPDPTAQYPNPTAQFPNPTAQYPNPTSQYSTPTGQYSDQVPTEQFSTRPPAGQWGTPPPPPPPTPTPPYGTPLPPPQGPPPPGPPPPGKRGSMWPWVAAAVAIFVIVIGGAVAYYLSSVSEEFDAAPRPTRTIVPTTEAAAPTTSFVPRFVAISGTVQSNDGTTLVISPDEGGAPVTVITDADTQVILGGDEGIKGFAPGDTVFVQGGEQEDGRVLARMIIGSLFGG